MKTPTAWDWSSARFWEGERGVPLEMDHPDEVPGRHETKTLLAQQWHHEDRSR